MKKPTKRMQLIHKIINIKKKYNIDDGIKILKEIPSVKFIESVDIAVNLGIDPKKTDQNVRGSIVLPHGIGRLIRVAVFTQGDNIKIAKKAGADFIGMNDLCEQIKKNGINFDVVIASPDAITTVSKIGSILGPRGLMPNLKLGTITEDLKNAINNAKSGQIRFRNDKYGILHTTIGKINFTAQNLKNNFITFLEKLKKLKPNQSKGLFIKKIILSTTMGVSIIIDPYIIN
ncbi:50S ribosomal protein L1 [Buchnera aphidicola (Eriosoma grossulariae)]|uniref:50S ribosomal protein L1 n=1 Tax=Buchnera aphidicola TaxID=9 RepID=UPI0034647BBC